MLGSHILMLRSMNDMAQGMMAQYRYVTLRCIYYWLHDIMDC